MFYWNLSFIQCEAFFLQMGSLDSSGYPINLYVILKDFLDLMLNLRIYKKQNSEKKELHLIISF